MLRTSPPPLWGARPKSPPAEGRPGDDRRRVSAGAVEEGGLELTAPVWEVYFKSWRRRPGKVGLERLA